MRAFLIEWSQPRTWPHVIESGTPAFAETDSDFDRQRIEAMSLREFANAGLVLVVDSAALGERVIFASHDVPQTRNMDGLTTYLAAELSQLVGMPVDQLRKVHALKKTFRAVIEFVGPALR
jgi:hypothetical protein